MPIFEIELSDGRVIDVESEREPDEQSVMSALQEFESEQPAPPPLEAFSPDVSRSMTPEGGVMATQAGSEVLTTPFNKMSDPLVSLPRFPKAPSQEEIDFAQQFTRIPLPSAGVFEATKGATDVVAETGEFLTSPVGLAAIPALALAGPTAAGLVGLGIGAQMAGSGLGTVSGSNDPETIGRGLGEATIGALMAFAGIPAAKRVVLQSTPRGRAIVELADILEREPMALGPDVYYGLQMQPAYGRSEMIHSFVGPRLKTVLDVMQKLEPERIRLEKVRSEAQAKQQRVRQQEEAVAARREGRPVVPEGPPPQPRVSVIQEIRQQGADTVAKIQELFPQAKLSREQARELRKIAYPPQQPTTGEPSASQVQQAATIHGDVRQQPVEGQGQVPAEVRGAEVRSEAVGDVTIETEPLVEIQSGRGKQDGFTAISKRKGETVGAIEADLKRDGSLMVFNSSLEPSLKGQRIGVEMYQRLLNHAQENGISKVTSDSSVSGEAVRVYESLKRQGYDVQRNTDVTTDQDGRIKSKDPNKPVFEITVPEVHPEAVTPEIPTTPKGTVRLYHGEGGAEGAGQGAAWYTESLDRARTFGPKISYVDVPVSKARELKQTGQDYVLPNVLIQKAKEYPVEVREKVEQLSEPTGTFEEEMAGIAKTAEPNLEASLSLTPALKTKDGSVIIGEVGKTHNDIYSGQGKTEGAMLRLQQPEHGFVRGDQFMSRADAAELLGQKEPMTSERLRDIQARARKTEPAEVVEPAPVEAPVEPAPVEAGALGIRPPGAEFIDKALEYFTPPKPQSTPELRIEHGKKMPRLQPYDTAKIVAASPQGMSRIPVLGALMDPRATAHTDADVSLITRAHSVSMGRNLRAIWEETQHQYRDALMADPETGLIELADGTKGYASDVFEAELANPGSQPLTDVQRQWLNEEYKPVLDEWLAMVREEGVRHFVDEDGNPVPLKNNYFPRTSIGKRNVPTAQATGGGRPGTQIQQQRKRTYETEEAGVKSKDSIIYEPDMVARVGKMMEDGYRSIADHRLANDPVLGGETVKERFDRLAEQHKESLDLLTKAEKEEAFTQLRELAAHINFGREGMAPVAPAFQHKIYPIEVASKLRKAYSGETSNWLSAANTLTKASKALTAVGDLSAPLIQGLPVLYRHPLMWANATLNSYRALWEPHVLGKAMGQPRNRVDMENFTQSGGNLGRLQDHMSGTEKGELATRIPVYGRFVRATGRAYGVFLDLAKLQLWRAYSKGAPKSEWPRIAETVENMLMMGRMEEVGVNPSRALGERLFFFAPIYYRGAGGLVSTALTRGYTGNMARQALGAYATGSLMVAIGSYLLLGMPWDEIKERLDPRKGKFLKIPVSVGNGRRVEIGIGNVLTQFFRLMAQSYDHLTTDKPISSGVEGNPFLRFLRGRAAFMPGIATDIITGRDYFGNSISVPESLTRRFMPFAIQAYFPREEYTQGQRVADAMFTFVGMQSFPENDYGRMIRKQNELSEEKYGLTYEELSLGRRAKLIHDFKRSDEYQKSEPTQSDMERFIRIAEQRRLDLEGAIAPETKARIDEMGFRVTSYKNTLRVGGQDVPLSKEEQERLQEILVEEYSKVVDRLKPDRFNRMNPVDSEKVWNDIQAAIRESARGRLMKEIQATTRDIATPSDR